MSQHRYRLYFYIMLVTVAGDKAESYLNHIELLWLLVSAYGLKADDEVKTAVVYSYAPFFGSRE